LVLEVDEDQHSSREDLCECTRMVNITSSFGMPTIFVRYNPDRYKPIRGNRQASFAKRVDVLQQWLKHLMTERPMGVVTFLRLFFDGYLEDRERLQVVAPFEKEIN